MFMADSTVVCRGGHHKCSGLATCTCAPTSKFLLKGGTEMKIVGLEESLTRCWGTSLLAAMKAGV